MLADNWSDWSEVRMSDDLSNELTNFGDDMSYDLQFSNEQTHSWKFQNTLSVTGKVMQTFDHSDNLYDFYQWVGSLTTVNGNCTTVSSLMNLSS